MKSLLLKNANIVFPLETRNTSLLIQDGKIDRIGERQISADNVIDLAGANVLPGFVDIHNHGAIGYDVNNSNSEDLISIGKFLAKHGVTSWLPTLVPDSDAAYEKTIEAIEKVLALQTGLPIAQIEGIHFEGVFANEEMCGALRPEYFKSYSSGSGKIPLPKLTRGVHLTTLAPEIENGIELIKLLRDEGWIISIGHTKANSAILNDAFKAGAHHFTHMFNAMTGLHHREIGVAGWALANENSTFDIIADGKHVDPRILKFAARAKSPDLVSLISDSIAPTGLGDGVYRVWGEEIAITKGQTQNGRGKIAGSVITLADAVRMMSKLDFSISEVANMASLNPARLLGLDNDIGSIEIGKSANLAVVDESGNNKLTVINGIIAG
ncbi:MAG: N-acetylglucosamine-6-phosphate deacetylase [Acidobacteria bacterium]|nr:N-acetylglucosamine-6-phosphate deacetylase [Acidobacteriota bacterium]